MDYIFVRKNGEITSSLFINKPKNEGIPCMEDNFTENWVLILYKKYDESGEVEGYLFKVFHKNDIKCRTEASEKIFVLIADQKKIRKGVVLTTDNNYNSILTKMKTLLNWLQNSDDFQNKIPALLHLLTLSVEMEKQAEQAELLIQNTIWEHTMISQASVAFETKLLRLEARIKYLQQLYAESKFNEHENM